MGAESALSGGGPRRGREGLGLLQEPLLPPLVRTEEDLARPHGPSEGPGLEKTGRGASHVEEAAKDLPPSPLPHHLSSVPIPRFGPENFSLSLGFCVAPEDMPHPASR